MQRRQAQGPYAITAAILIAVVCACTRVPNLTGPSRPAGQTTAAPALITTQTTPPPPVAVNEEARDGAFAFIVGAVSTATDESIGEGGEKITAQGVFVWIGMWVTNIGRSQHTYFANDQRLSDSHSRLFSPNLRAVDPEYSQADINPGNRTIAYLAFDVPKGTLPSQYVLLLHAAPDSAGAAITLPDDYRKSSPPPMTTG